MMVKTFVITALAVFLSTSPALSIPGWRDFTTGNINENGRPFWDNPSLDTGNRNVGYFLTGTGNVFGGGTNYLGTGPQFLGEPYSSADDGATNPGAASILDFGFINANTPRITATFLLRVTDWFATDTVGIFDPNNINSKTALFGPGDTVGATKTVDIYPLTNTAFYHFGIYGLSPDGTFYTHSSKNPAGDTSHQHFAVFRDKNNPLVIYVGFEDLINPGTEGPGDYNDMVISFQFIAAPLPGTVLLLGTGLTCLAWYSRRRV